MFSSPFLPLPAGFKIATTTRHHDLLMIQVVSTNMRSCCPLCFCLAERRHSQYTRMVADLPCAGFRIQLILHVRRFFCDNANCMRKIFTERLPAFVLPWARLTVRLCEALQSVGLATCGELGTRLADRLAIQTSPTTILRRLMALPTVPVKQVSELGIDLKNLGEALEAVLAHHLAAHRTCQTQELKATPLETAHGIQPPKPHLKAAQLSQAKREERLAEYQHVVSLRTLGFSQTAIADQVGVAHSTVSRWLSDGAFPEQKPRRRKMELDSHMPYLRQRWEAGCHNIAQLYRELVARGYTHSYWSVYEQLLRFFPEGRKNPQTPDQLARPPVLARYAVFLFLRRPTEELSLEEQETLELLRSLHPDVNQAYELVQQFVHMLHTRTGEQLDTWLEYVRTSQIHELQSFVVSIERDKAAVVAGLTLTQNNGLVEGKVNKLKLLKRMMYGRAEFPLLRQRVLHAF
jgi:transposase